MTDEFLRLATPDALEWHTPLIERAASGWAEAQAAFLDLTDRYLEKELAKPADDNIHSHEAGGQWRIAFPHLNVRHDDRVASRLAEVMEARKRWTDRNLYHGYHDCAEVHHEIETFIYFQTPLLYARLPGWETALASIEDVAHHAGNWAPGAPDWFDWKRQEFASVFLGTRAVRDFPPFDYQEANHFRFVSLALAAYSGDGRRRYLDLATSYAERWRRHIEGLDKSGEPIRCSILPEGVEAGEMIDGANNRNTDSYRIFYSEVAENTAYDIASGLLDVFRVAGDKRCLQAGEAIFDQLVRHAVDGRPAACFRDGEWLPLKRQSGDPDSITTWITTCAFLARYAVRHDLLTGQSRYRDPIVRWAESIDEETNPSDQMMANVLVAGHFYTGRADWLRRACAMAIRAAAVVEHNDEFHQCAWRSTRQGIRFLMEFLYQPILCSPEWGTRGGIPVRGLVHESDGRRGLPDKIAFRCWRGEDGTLRTEAVNRSGEHRQWRISFMAPRATEDGQPEERRVSMSLEPSERKTDSLRIDGGRVLPASRRSPQAGQ